MTRPTSIAWAKLSANIYGNRKIRWAGRLGREVYVFVLAQNAARGATGSIPAADLDAWYVADQLMMSEADAADGVERAIAAGLIRRSGAEFDIVGWDDEWAKGPLTEAERKRLQRARTDPAEVMSGQCPDTVRTESRCPDNGTGEERKEKEERAAVAASCLLVKQTGAASAGASSPDSVDDAALDQDSAAGAMPDIPRRSSSARRTRSVATGDRSAADALAAGAVAEINRLGGTRYAADAAELVRNCRALAKAKVTADDVVRVIAAKWAEWGTSDKMRGQFKPATLMRPSNFLRYRDDIAAGATVGGKLLVLTAPAADHVVIDGVTYNAPAEVA